MKKLLLAGLFFLALSAKAQKITNKTVEVACGECQFKMKGDHCDLAVKIDGKTYFVDGAKLDEHGDAHAKDGMCNAVRKAEVSGEIVDGRFKATSFKLLKPKVVKS